MKSTTPGRPRKYPDVTKIIQKRVKSQWDNGNSWTKNDLDQWVKLFV